MHILTAHEGRTPSTDKPQNKSDLVSDSTETTPPQSDEISFTDTFAGLPEQNQFDTVTHQTLDTTDVDMTLQPEDIANETSSNANDGYLIELATSALSDFPDESTVQDIDVQDEELEKLEITVAEVISVSETPKTQTLEIAVTSETTNTGTNSKEISAKDIKRRPLSDLQVTPQETANPNLLLKKDEIPFEDLPRYVKTVGEKALPPQNSLTQFHSSGLVSEDSNMPIIQTSPLTVIGSTALQSSPTLQAQTNLQVMILPIREVVQNVVQATLKQERTLIRIDPPELGRIQLDFDHSSSGKTIVTLSAETDSVKLMLVERRAFMVGLFESYGLDDVEIQMGNNFDSDAQSSNGQFFSNREGHSYLDDQAENTGKSAESENELTSREIKNTHLNSQSNSSRLHIRV